MFTLYYAPKSRSIRALWMLEEIGCPYEKKHVDIRSGQGRNPEYLALNPHGKVPTLVHDGAVIPDSTAILLYLADLFPDAKLAPPIGDRERGPYLAAMMYTAAVMEPSLIAKSSGWAVQASRVAWGSFDDMMRRLRELTARPYVLGERFTAADILIGGAIQFATMTGMLPQDAAFADYVARITARPAFKRALEKDSG